MARTRDNFEPIIAALVSEGPQSDPFVRAKAACEFSALIRWPKDKTVREGAAAVMMARYVASYLLRENIKLTSSEQLDVLSQYANVDRLLSLIFAGTDLSTVTFWDEQEAERWCIAASTVRFLLFEQARNARPRNDLSLKQCKYVLAHDGLYGSGTVSAKKFQGIWRTYKEVSFFHYVNRYLFHGKWNLNPSEPDFFDSLDALLADRSGLENYFRQSLYLMTALKEGLKPRARERLTLPKFPKWIIPMPIPSAAPDGRIARRLEKYRG